MKGSRKPLWLLIAAMLVVSLAAACSSPAKPTAQDGGAKAAAPAEETPDPQAAEGGAESAAPAAFPPAPADASGMQAWFGEAFPKAAWLGRIKKTEYVAGEVPDSGGFRDAIVITTDLDFGSEQALGTEIHNAVGEAHPTWAKQCVIRYADGANIYAGDIVDMTP